MKVYIKVSEIGDTMTLWRNKTMRQWLEAANFPKWVEALVVAVAGGAITAAGDAYMRGDTDLHKLKGVAIGGAVVGLLAWWRQSPVQKIPMPTPQDPPKGE